MIRSYSSPEAFKQALESRLRATAQRRSLPIGRVRQLFVVERLLVRLEAKFPNGIIAKGGLALEMRLSRARTTKDLDLRMAGSTTFLARDLEAAVASAFPDWLVFRIREDSKHPTIDGDGVVYEGHRFVASAALAGKPFGDPFGVDIGFGDILTEAPDVIEGSDLLEFVGIARPRFHVYPRVAHVAEKLHAYTLPRLRENTRVKDLPDLALLATTGTFAAPALRAALEATFRIRGTQGLPAALPPPPDSWHKRYAAIALGDGLPWKTLEEVYTAASAFLDPVLSGSVGEWNPPDWAWRDLP